VLIYKRVELCTCIIGTGAETGQLIESITAMPPAKALLAAVAAASSVLAFYLKHSIQVKGSQGTGRRDVAKPFVVDLESTSSPNKRIKRIASSGPDKLHDAQSPELKKGMSCL
jgi:hypothetical protein